MADGMLVPATTMYFGTVALLFLGAALIVGLGLRSRGYTRRMYLVGAIPGLAMAVAYIFMGMEWLTVTTAGREQSVVRFVGYMAAIVAFVYLVRELLELTVRESAVLTVVLWLQPVLALVSWLFTGTLNSILSLGALVGFLLSAYALLRPITRRATQAAGERRLLYMKLRNLFVLCTGLLVLQSVISEQSLGLTNLFVGQLAASYTDLVLTVGIGFLVVSGKEIYEQVTLESTDTQEQTETVATPPASGGDS